MKDTAISYSRYYPADFLSMAKLELELSNGNRLFSDKYGVFLVKNLDDMPEIVDGNRTYIQCE